MAEVHGESKLTFLESTSIIIGHGVGSGILSVPFLASRNNWYDIIWIAAVAYCMNLLLHFMIAELSLNNNGAQFIKCFENELFVGKLKMACTWLAFGLLGFSVVVNVSGFITGAAAVFSAWFHLPSVAGMLLFYVLAASVVYIGMKLVGICEKIACDFYVWSHRNPFCSNDAFRDNRAFDKVSIRITICWSLYSMNRIFHYLRLCLCHRL